MPWCSEMSAMPLMRNAESRYGSSQEEQAGFAKKLEVGFQVFLESSESADLLGRFRSAYQYRRRVGFVSECHDNGLQSAITRALDSYDYPSNPERCPHRVAEVTDSYKQALSGAMESVLETCQFAVSNFERSLRGRGLDPNVLSPEEMSHQLGTAFERYCERWNYDASAEL